MVVNGQIVVVTPVAFAGAMSPITLSGTLIQYMPKRLRPSLSCRWSGWARP